MITPNRLFGARAVTRLLKEKESVAIIHFSRRIAWSVPDASRLLRSGQR
jgi:hypothetical protein